MFPVAGKWVNGWSLAAVMRFIEAFYVLNVSVLNALQAIQGKAQ